MDVLTDPAVAKLNDEKDQFAAQVNYLIQLLELHTDPSQPLSPAVRRILTTMGNTEQIESEAKQTAESVKERHNHTWSRPAVTYLFAT